MWMQSVVGAFSFLFLAWSVGRFQRPDIRKIGILLVAHVLLVAICLKAPGAPDLLRGFGYALGGLQRSVLKGTSFVFGYIGGGQSPFMIDPDAKGSSFILIFQALPIIVVMGAISMILFHTGILPWVVQRISNAMEKTKLIGGGLATALAGKIFLGQTDSPLLVRPYLANFSTNELFTLMVAGMATSVSTIFGLYSSALSPVMKVDTTLVHLGTSAIVNIIAALVIAECMRPQKGSMTNGECNNPYAFHSVIEAISRGATDGWNIMMMIASMMIALISLADIANGLFGQLMQYLTGTPFSLQDILGYVFAPLSWCMGVAWSECIHVGSILAEKTMVNEWVAISNIVKGSYGVLSERTMSIALYSTCVFSNLSSVGVQIACLGALAPTRLKEIVHLGPLALVAALLAGGLSSAVVSLMI